MDQANIKEPFPYDVFLSHSAKDKAVVRPLAQRLQNDGLKVWFDEWVLKPGDPIQKKIDDGLEESRVLVLCMSANAFGSDWAQLEAGTFRFRDPLNKERRFIPLRLDDAPIKGSLAQFLCIGWLQHEREQKYLTLLNACRHPAHWPPAPIDGGYRRLRCKLDCKDLFYDGLHMRPASYIAALCNRFSQTEFKILRNEGTKKSTKSIVNPKRITELLQASFAHNEEVTVEVTGECRIMASEFFKLAWENLRNYGDDVSVGKIRLNRLIDETFQQIDDPDVTGIGASPHIVVGHEDRLMADECRSIAKINTRLHNLVLAMVPLVTKHFESDLQILFEDPLRGAYCFTVNSTNGFTLDDRIMELSIEVGKKITLVTSGPNREKANAAIKAMLENLGECNVWLQNRASGLEAETTLRELIEFAENLSASQNVEFIHVQNPFLSPLLTPRHVFVNPPNAEFTKDEVLHQLAAPHAKMHRIEMSLLMGRITEAEKKHPIMPREGFAISHAAMEDAPLISITFGVYPNGVIWEDSGKKANLVAMVIFSKENYRTWYDFWTKMRIVLRENPSLREQLVWSRTSEDFITMLGHVEAAAVKLKMEQKLSS